MTTATTDNKKIKNHDKLSKLIGPTEKLIDASAREKIVLARVSMLLKNSFFGNLSTRLQLTNADEWLATAATDGRKFYYNSRFINMLTTKEIEFLVGHEVLHIVYDHMGRREERDPTIWNIAADYCVNADLKRHHIGDFITTVPCLYSPDYDGMGAEEVYDHLMKNADNVDLDSLVDQLIDDHMDDDGDAKGDNADGKRPQKMSPAEREQLRQEIKENIINAANQAAGKEIPDSVKRMISHLTEPKMPWRELIQTMLTSTVKTDYSFMRPSRRGWHLDAILPSQMPGEEIEITIAIDTSGSIKNSDLQLFLSEVQGIMDSFSGYRIHIFSFDTRVHNPADYSSENLDTISEYVPDGYGGTDFDSIFDYLKEESIVPNRLIVFTDGYPYGSWGSPNYCDTTWIIYGDKSQSIQPPFGTWAYLD